jgi:beta-glucosidase
MCIRDRPEETPTILEALREALPGREILTASTSIPDQMLYMAQNAGLVILVVGESDQRNGENHNLTRLELPAGQDALIEQVCALGVPVVLVVVAGRPLNLTRAAQNAQAVLWAWQPGSMGAAAVVDVLLGKAEPGGRLPMTFPRSEGQVPLYYNFKSSGKAFDLVHLEVPPGYRHPARYLDSRSDPLYPFGFGLGYSTFAYADLQVQPRADGARVSVQVTNTGARAGECVAQLYVQDCIASLTRPVRELKGFQRAALQPGETRRLEFDLGFEELAFYRQDGKLALEPGEFRVWVGADCTAALEGRFTIGG